MRKWSAILTTTAVLAAVTAEGRAHADVPGADRQIVFARQIESGVANVFIADPDGTHVQQVPLTRPAEDFGIPVWSPDRSRLLISHVVRFDASGNLLPFRPATVDKDGANFTLLDTPNAPDSMGCFGGWYPDSTRLLCSFGGNAPGVCSASVPPMAAPLSA
jgi:hypothetical protein